MEQKKIEQAYIQELYVQEDDLLKSVTTGLVENGLPLISVPPEVGKAIYLLAKISGAKRALEIGLLGGYSTIWLTRGMGMDGEVVSLEIKEEHASFARQNLSRAGLLDQVSIYVGDALLSLDQLISKKEKFDFIVIDADKINYPVYIEKVLQLADPGAILCCDNLFFNGRIFDKKDALNPAPAAVRKVNEILSSHPRLEAILFPIGDGLGVARVKV
ncbi:O-methyltransferase [Thermoactinomyces sp. DSM 45892]|uniref:O-methyltransferase n=1 Tax=Thermoactinomyces sp. DSM 45892 TaxID=1882753 RepID=UPI0008969D95|nr:O-methyltransferase [Thermoactinomyces sp. DSM 45892]SDY68338.1 Predicted O-methyltransferase YrrM [Thermoactinomyces sp. DSM 45892]